MLIPRNMVPLPKNRCFNLFDLVYVRIEISWRRLAEQISSVNLSNRGFPGSSPFLRNFLCISRVFNTKFGNLLSLCVATSFLCLIDLKSRTFFYFKFSQVFVELVHTNYF